MSSNIPILLDSQLWLPAGSEAASRARSELQYTILEGDQLNPIYRSFQTYEEDTEWLRAPRHYLDLNEIDYQWRGTYQFPDLTGTCSIEPYNQIQKEAREFLGGACNPGEHPALRDAFVNLRCGEGKTFLGIMTAFDYGKSTLVVAPTTIIVDQWRERLLQYTSVREIGSIVSGSYDIKPITLALIQSLLALGEDRVQHLADYFGLTIFDEAHKLAAPVFSRMGNAFRGRRIGLSATLNRTDGLSDVYWKALGRSIFHRISTRKKAKVLFHRTASTDVPTHKNYAKSVTMLEESAQYLSEIEADIRRDYAALRKQLILTSRRAVLAALLERLQDLSVGEIHGDVAPADRTLCLKTRRIILSEMSLGKEGLDESSLDTLRVITPIKDANALVQIVGRLEREGGQEPLAHFYSPIANGVFMRTLDRARDSLIRSGYNVREVLE